MLQFTVGHPLTERKMHQSDKEFPLTADLREHILSELPCGLCVARQDERLSVLFANDNYYRMIGYANASQARADGLTGALDCVEAGMRAQMLARMAVLDEAEEQAVALEARLRRRDGTVFWSIVHVSRADSGGGLWICAFMDISAQKRVEEALRVREEEYRIAVRQSDKLVFRYDIAEETAYLPPESAELFHKDVIRNVPARLQEKDMIGPDSLDAFRELHAQIVGGVHPTGDAVLNLSLSCDKSAFEWYRVAYSLIYSEEDTPVQAVISLQNVTQQREARSLISAGRRRMSPCRKATRLIWSLTLRRTGWKRKKARCFCPCRNRCRARWSARYSTFFPTMCMPTIGSGFARLSRGSIF